MIDILIEVRDIEEQFSAGSIKYVYLWAYWVNDLLSSHILQ